MSKTLLSTNSTLIPESADRRLASLIAAPEKSKPTHFAPKLARESVS